MTRKEPTARQGVAQRCASRLLDIVVRMRTSEAREKMPRFLRTCGYRLLPKRRLARKMWQAQYDRVMQNVRPVPLRTSVTLGIIKDFMMKYANYEAACLELGVPYRLIDIAGDRWIDRVQSSGCDAFLVWPSHCHSRSKQMFDERLRVLTEDLRKVIFPSFRALWLYESKRRMSDWLTAHGIPHPRTWVFFEPEPAMEFLAEAPLPLVFKTDLGSATSGVKILRRRGQARRLVKLCFGKGFLGRRHDPRDREWGCVLFQEYIANAKEWRMIRIGGSFFGHQKLREGDFHSGTHLVGWYRPPDELLDFCREVTDKGPFLSMDVDVLETEDGRYLVNELQAVFGSKDPEQMYVDGKAGRFVYDKETGSWCFEEGRFCRNVLCNLRVKTLLELLGRPLEPMAEAEKASP